MITLSVRVDGERNNELKRWRGTEAALEQQARGEVIPAEDVFAWLDTWGEEGEGINPETALHPGCKGDE